MKRKAKVQRQFAYKYKEKDHYKHVVTISENLLKELGWQIGVEVEQRVEGNTLVMVPVNPRKAKWEEHPSKDLTTEIHEQVHPSGVHKEKHTRKVHENAKRRIR